MALSKEEIAQIAKATALEVIAARATFHKPATIVEGIQDSMGEEVIAYQFYQLRAKHARKLGDEVTAGMYEHIASEEFRHYEELSKRQVDLF